MTVSTKSKLILATVSGALLFATGTGIALADDQREGARSERVWERRFAPESGLPCSIPMVIAL
jgi:hypothetical protein